MPETRPNNFRVNRVSRTGYINGSRAKDKTPIKDKMSLALKALAEEDPTFEVKVDEQTGQTILYGMGELHLEVLIDRMLREFKVAANVGNPRVAYRETITESVRKSEGRFVRQSGWKRVNTDM